MVNGAFFAHMNVNCEHQVSVCRIGFFDFDVVVVVCVCVIIAAASCGCRTSMCWGVQRRVKWTRKFNAHLSFNVLLSSYSPRGWLLLHSILPRSCINVITPVWCAHLFFSTNLLNVERSIGIGSFRMRRKREDFDFNWMMEFNASHLINWIRVWDAKYYPKSFE